MKACINNQQIRHYNQGVLAGVSVPTQNEPVNRRSLRLAQIPIPAVSNILRELEEEGTRGQCAVMEHLAPRSCSSGGPALLRPGWRLDPVYEHHAHQVSNASLKCLSECERQTSNTTPLTPQRLRHCWQRLRNAGISTVRTGPGRKSIWRWRFASGRLDAEREYHIGPCRRPRKQPVEMKYLLEEKLNVRVMVDNDCARAGAGGKMAK